MSPAWRRRSPLPIARAPSSSRHLLDGACPRGGEEAAEPALTGPECPYGLGEIGGAEVGPHPRREVELRVCAPPKGEGAEALLPAGADEKIHVGRPSTRLGKTPLELCL